MWSNISPVSGKETRSGNEHRSTGTKSPPKKSSKPVVKREESKQRRKSGEEHVRFTDSPQERTDQDVESIQRPIQGQNENFRVKFDQEETPVERITVPHRDRKIPPSPLSERSKKRYSSAADDAFDDNGSYVEGTTDKFLDILEDRICSPSTPSLCEIEKRIEESWKEIESKTSQFFRCRKSCTRAATDMTRSNQVPPQQQQDAAKNDASSKLKSMVSCSATNEFKSSKEDDDDDDDEKRISYDDSPEWKDSRDEDESLDDEDEADDDEAGEQRDPAKDSKDWEDDEKDTESNMRDTVDLNSYTDTYLKVFNERSTTVDAVPQTRSMYSTSSTDYDASTLTTIQTESLATIAPVPLDPPSLAPPPALIESCPRKTPMPKTSTSLTVFEPTNSSALLVQSALTISSKGPTPMRLPAGGAPGGHYMSMPDLDPNFQKRCFSPQLGKKQGVHLGIINTTSTSSTEQSGRSQKSADSKGEAATAGNHAYIAYFQRGTDAKGVVRLYEHPTPAAFPTLNQEIVVRISYSTISHTDCAVRRGTYWGNDSIQPLSLPIIPGVSFSGHVTQLDRAAMRSGMRYGDRVISLVRVGANARHICIARDRVVIVPDELIDEKKIACLPEIYLGAFQVLHMGQKNGARFKRSSLAGKTILILGGATILGKALIELCHAGGAYAVYATGKERHFPAIEEAKATPLNRDPRHWYSLLKGRIDLVVGLDNDSFGHSEASAQHLEVLSSKGRAVLFGAPENTCDTAIDKHRKIFVYNVFDSWEKDIKQAKRDLSHLCKLLIDGTINPHILETIPLNQIAEAQDTVEHRDFSSFLLCDPWTPTKREASKIVPRTVVYSETIGSIKTAKSKKKYGTGDKYSTGLSTDELVSI